MTKRKGLFDIDVDAVVRVGWVCLILSRSLLKQRIKSATLLILLNQF